MRILSAGGFALALLVAGCGDDPSPQSDDGGLGGDVPAFDLGPPDGGGADAGGASDVGSTDVSDAGTSTGTGPTTYYVIRHTERDPGVNPPINVEGQARAARLADALENAGIDEIVTTEFIRGQQSGQVLADRTGMGITVAPITPVAWSAFGTSVGDWQRAREVPGRTYLLIGHSGGYNTALIRALGAVEGASPLAERYQDLVLVQREADGTVRLSILQYGGVSSLDP